MDKPLHPLTLYREANDLSLEALGLLLGGLHKSTVLRWESGEVLIPTDRAKPISEITKIPLHVLRPDIWDAPADEAAA